MRHTFKWVERYRFGPTLAAYDLLFDGEYVPYDLLRSADELNKRDWTASLAAWTRIWRPPTRPVT